MRKIGLLVFVAALAALTFVPSAQAVSLLEGDVTIHLQDATTLWTEDPAGGGALIPREPNWVTPGSLAGFAPDGIAVGDESRSVFNVDSFEYLDHPDVVIPDGELTGLVYNLTVSSYVFISPTQVAVNFTGGRVAFYLDTSPEGTDEEHIINPVATPAPLEWVEDSATWGGAGMDGYTNVNLLADGVTADPGSTLWLLGDFLPVDVLGTTLTYVVNLSTGLGSSAGGFVNLIGGSELGLFTQGIGTTPLGADYDMSFQYTTSQDPDNFYYTSTFADDGLWQISSSDPVRANVVPEPATLSLLGLGVIGLIARRRKRSK
jgi:hypothetical protein